MADPLAEVGDLVSQTLGVLSAAKEEDQSLPLATSAYDIDLSPPLLISGSSVGAPLPSHVMQDQESVDVDLGSPVPSKLPATPELLELRSGTPSATPAGPVTVEVASTSTAASLAGQPQQQRSTSESSIRVRVKEPEKAEVVSTLGIKSHHFVYVLQVDSTLPGLLATAMEVRRRFSEFDTLHKLLRSEYRGCFIPPLPSKTFLDNNSEEFLRLRRADLQAFLRAVVLHPVLQQSEILKVFLLQPGDLARNPAWLLMLNGRDAPRRSGSLPDDGTSTASSSTAGNAALTGLNTWVTGLNTWVKQSTQQAIAVFQPPKRELPADEEGLRQTKELLLDLERLLQLATHSARTLCQDMEKMSTDFREFGFNMGMLAKFEDAVQTKVGQYTPEGHSASNRAADFTKAAMCQAKQHSVWKAAALKAAANLVTLHDYHIIIPEAVRAMEDREAALEQAYVLEEELAHKRHSLEVAQASGGAGAARGPGSSEKRIAALAHSIGELEAQAKAAREQYEVIKSRNQAELSRLGLEREADFHAMMATFASHQAALMQSSADLWAQMASQFAGEAKSQ